MNITDIHIRSHSILPIIAVLGIGLLAGTNLGMLVGFTIPGVLFFASLGIISGQPEEDKKFLTHLFIIAFVLRAIVGTTIHILNLRDFFAADAWTYDGFGYQVAQSWLGQYSHWMEIIEGREHPGYIYTVGAIYYVVGHQPLVAQAINWIAGSFTVFLTFLIAKKMFNRDVAKYSAVFAAVMPCFVIWEAQLLKDPIIIFCLCLCIYSVMNLQEQFSLFYILIWISTLVILFYFRVYLFYIMGATSAVSLFVGQRIGLLPMIIIMTILLSGSVFMAQKLGFISQMQEAQERNIGKGEDAFQKIDHLRRSLAGQGAGGNVGSSYLANTDVSTPEKAVAFLPLGTIYLLFAPFPWMIKNLRQAITLPEMIVWWYLIPSFIRGLIYGVKERFSYVSSPLLFSMGLTAMYALFEGNVGTAYRQRTQIFIFYIIFVSAGLCLKRQTGSSNISGPGDAQQ